MKRFLLLILLLGLSPVQAAEQTPPGHACATAHPLATEACLDVLQAGGNAFDAAVAATAAIAVVEPTGSGIGGGGFWLLHRESDGFETFIDGRETAPLAAGPKMFLDSKGKAVDALSRDGALAAAIPGEPAALEHLAKHYGKLPLQRSLAPAIRYAREGFVCDDKLARAFEFSWKRLSPAAKDVFEVDGRPPRSGELIRQEDLARTLELIATQGRDGFYTGALAQTLLESVRAAGGIWTAEDLRRYRVVERKPLEFNFRDTRIVTAPPPSAGGVTLAQTLAQLEALGWKDGSSLESKHLVVEALRRAYRDRAIYLADPDFVSIPMHRLTSRSYALELASSISRERATPSKSLPPAPAVKEGDNTTHISVIDKDGNRVAATLSINLTFGSGFMAPGTGVFLNDEMDDFAASVDASNAYGLVGSAVNLVEPGKRPLSSMTPTFVEGPHGLLIIGTPGGSRIITMVLLGILGWTEGLQAQQVVALPRYHHQYLPDAINFEPGAFTPDEQAALKKLGHALYPAKDSYGNMQVVTWNPHSGVLNAASDPRGVGIGLLLAPH